MTCPFHWPALRALSQPPQVCMWRACLVLVWIMAYRHVSFHGTVICSDCA